MSTGTYNLFMAPEADAFAQERQRSDAGMVSRQTVSKCFDMDP